jgi:ferredoxin/flavodoxin
MEQIRTVDVVYFTGTQGTARVAAAFEKAFEEIGVTVYKSEINVSSDPVPKGDILLLLYPVYAANAPRPVDEWIKNIPASKGVSAAVLSISGGGETLTNTACRISSIKELEKKGYLVFYEEMFIMPANCFMKYSATLHAMILKAMPEKVERAVGEITARVGRRTKPYIVDRVLSKIGALVKKLGKSFGKKLHASSLCNGCGWCAQHCPTGNIVMQNEKPVFDGKCAICLRCIYGCPQKAIEAGAGKKLLIQDGFDLEKIEEQTIHITEFPPVDEVTKGFSLKGVRQYLKEE